MKFYANKKTGAFAVACVGAINDPDFNELIPNDTDAAQEKHVPVITVDGNTVTVDVGSVAHPMTGEHLIAVIMLQTCCGFQMRHLKPGDAPKAVFKLNDGEKAVAAYEYCNLHGLWTAKI